MGNCCDGGKRVEISGKEGSTPQAVGYTTRQSEPLTQGQTTSTLRMTTKTTAGASANGGRVDTGTTLQGHGGDYGLEPPLRYPMDASGVHYQPVGGPSLALGLFDDKDGSDKDTQESRPASLAAAPGGAVTAEAATAAVAEAIAAAGVAETIPLNLPVSSVQSFITTSATHIASTSTQGATTTVVDTAKPTFPLRQRSNYQPSDVMISYSRSDGEIMQQIKDELEAQSITVWVDQSSIDAGADFLSKIGEAIIDAKFFICILSDRAVRSKYCRDEVALAYVSNTAIFPVNLQPRDQLLPMMDTGLKLQLSNYNWTSLTDSSTRLDSIRTLVSTMKAELDDLSDPHTESGDLPPSFPAFPDGMSPPPISTPEGSDKAVTSPGEVTVTLEREGSVPSGGSGVQSPVSEGEGPDFNKRMRELRERNRAVMALHGDDVSRIMPEQFWTDQFGVVDHVTWERFTGAFLEVFKNPVQDTFTSEDQQQLLDILHRELEVDDDQRIFKYQLMAFCSIHGDTSPVWGRVHEQARESFAMREVFNMDSSVRVEAIENLGKFRSAVVIDALRDLLSDPDANVRAVATVSLSRTNANDPVTIRHIMRTLSDKDRLVREAGCLALGHLKARQAISKLSHLWRNDVISHVREAAAVALRQIGGQEVEDVMRVTKVLAEEIRSLTEEKPQ